MPIKINRFIYWTPRILSILFILFISLFSLDIFDLSLGFWGTIVGLLMHNIHSFVLTTVLIISWKHEIVGGVAFILAGLLYMALLLTNQFEWYMISWSLIIAGPAFFIGYLFLLNWFKKKKIALNNNNNTTTNTI